ncbi:unnamed protein product [Sphagnum jensenii]|uniref:Uncharacterized protein n=1 Tax=Sphagnum jensenii TaxID=128206 RepID=A0ABP1A7D4_9BRYO
MADATTLSSSSSRGSADRSSSISSPYPPASALGSAVEDVLQNANCDLSWVISPGLSSLQQLSAGVSSISP